MLARKRGGGGGGGCDGIQTTLIGKRCSRDGAGRRRDGPCYNRDLSESSQNEATPVYHTAGCRCRVGAAPVIGGV